MISGTVTVPLVHVAWATAGATGRTGMHVTVSNVTSNVAVVALCLPTVASVSGHATPAAFSVAVTVAVEPDEYPLAGATV